MHNSQYGGTPPWQPHHGPPHLNGPNAYNHPPPQGPPTYGGYPHQPPAHGYGPPPPQGAYMNHPPPPPQQHPASPPALLLKREGDNSTISLYGPDGRPLYRSINTHRSSVSSKPDHVITHAPSGADIGSIRYHHWVSEGLDYWEVGGSNGGSKLWAWHVEHADAQHTRWTCYRKGDLAWYNKLFSDRAPVARMSLDWPVYNAHQHGDLVIGRCDLYDAGLLFNPARRAELDEFYVTAVVMMDGAFKAVARAGQNGGGKIKDWTKFADKLSDFAESAGHGDGSGGDFWGGDGGGGGDGGAGAAVG